jgi:peptidoglycan/xylan/chitin deacetylase (PgdA/CDA1 family)
MASKSPARTATITVTAWTVLAAGGLTACHDTTAPRAAGRTPTASRSGGHTRHRRPKSAGSTAPRRTHRPARDAPRPASLTVPPPAPLPPVISHLPVHRRIVFVTVDDGWEKDPSFVRLVRERHIPLTLFLTNDAIKSDYGYFRALQRAGARIENHTLTHAYLPKLSYARQRREICGPLGIYAHEYGARPTLFRAPYGATNVETLVAARDCGVKAVFFWREVVTHGRIAYQLPGRRLRPGDILLVHFNPNMAADFKRMLHTIRKQGFTPAPLWKHLPAGYLRR